MLKKQQNSMIESCDSSSFFILHIGETTHNIIFLKLNGAVLHLHNTSSSTSTTSINDFHLICDLRIGASVLYVKRLGSDWNQQYQFLQEESRRGWSHRTHFLTDAAFSKSPYWIWEVLYAPYAPGGTLLFICQAHLACRYVLHWKCSPDWRRNALHQCTFFCWIKWDQRWIFFQLFFPLQWRQGTLQVQNLKFRQHRPLHISFTF